MTVLCSFESGRQSEAREPKDLIVQTMGEAMRWFPAPSQSIYFFQNFITAE